MLKRTAFFIALTLWILIQVSLQSVYFHQFFRGGMKQLEEQWKQRETIGYKKVHLQQSAVVFESRDPQPAIMFTDQGEYLLKADLDQSLDNHERDLLVEFTFKLMEQGHAFKGSAEIKLLPSDYSNVNDISEGTQSILSFGIHEFDENSGTIKVQFTKQNRLWVFEHKFEVNEVQMRQPHILRLLWHRNGKYLIGLDQNILNEGFIQTEFKRIGENHQGHDEDSDDECLPWKDVEESLRELKKVPKFLDDEKKVISDEYIIKKIKMEKKMANQCEPKKPKQKDDDIKINNGIFDQAVKDVALSLHVDNPYFIVSNILVADINDAKSENEMKKLKDNIEKSQKRAFNN